MPARPGMPSSGEQGISNRSDDEFRAADEAEDLADTTGEEDAHDFEEDGEDEDGEEDDDPDAE